MWAVAIAFATIASGGCGRFSFTEHDPPGDGRGSGIDSNVMADDGDVDAPTYACSGNEVCDGFESGFGTVWTTQGMVSIDTTRAHRGTQSVHVHSPAFAANTGSYHSIYETQTVASNINPFWVRGWLWLSALPAFDNGLELITAEAPSAAGDYVFVHADSTKVYSQYDAQIMSTSTLVPTGQWFCLIWKVTRNTGTSGSLELTGDVTVSLPNAKTDSTANPMQVVVFGLGYSSTNVPVPQPAQDLWIDDVIVSATAVTCDD